MYLPLLIRVTRTTWTADMSNRYPLPPIGKESSPCPPCEKNLSLSWVPCLGIRSNWGRPRNLYCRWRLHLLTTTTTHWIPQRRSLDTELVVVPNAETVVSPWTDIVVIHCSTRSRGLYIIIYLVAFHDMCLTVQRIWASNSIRNDNEVLISGYCLTNFVIIAFRWPT